MTRLDVSRELRQALNAARPISEHRLALPEHHVPRPDVAASILERVGAIGSGYLRVLGPPGCGKTTLATWIAGQPRR